MAYPFPTLRIVMVMLPKFPNIACIGQFFRCSSGGSANEKINQKDGRDGPDEEQDHDLLGSNGK